MEQIASVSQSCGFELSKVLNWQISLRSKFKFKAREILETYSANWLLTVFIGNFTILLLPISPVSVAAVVKQVESLGFGLTDAIFEGFIQFLNLQSVNDVFWVKMKMSGPTDSY